MKNKAINNFLKLVDVKFAGQTPPSCPEDPRLLTVGFPRRILLVS